MAAPALNRLPSRRDRTRAWCRWIAALRAGPLASLVAAAQADALTREPALVELWVAAEQEIASRLLLCSARERLLDADRRGDCLVVELGDGLRAELPLVRRGAFELDWARLGPPGPGSATLDPLELVARVADRHSLPVPDRERLVAEIRDSIVNLAQARLARELRERLATRPGRRDDPRLADPEHFVTDGHPWHPMTRTRLGLGPGEVLRYAGEQLAMTPVACLDLDRDIARIAGDYDDEVAQWFGEAGPGRVRIPVHPGQRRRIARLFPELWARGAIRPAPASAPVRIGRSLLSLRTLALGPERHLKLALDVHTTSTRRWVSPMSVHNGPVLSRLIADIQARDPVTAPIQLWPEAAAAGLEPERVGPLAGQLGAIFRQIPATPAGTQAWVCAAIGERWPGTDAVVLEHAARGYPGTGPERIAALVDAWIEGLVPPALRLWTHYGVALEWHLQNTLVRIADGRLRGFCVRDLGGVRIHPARLAAAGLPRTPSFADHSFIITDDLTEVRGKLEHTLFHAHLAHVFAIAGTLGVDEDSSWDRLRRTVGRCLNTWAEDPSTSAELRVRLRDELDALTRPRVRAKALLRMRLSERSSDYEYTEVANALAPTGP